MRLFDFGIRSAGLGGERIDELISNPRNYGVKSVFLTGNSGYDQAGHYGRKFTIYYANNPWYIREGGGAVSGVTILGHELDHAYIQQGGKLSHKQVENEGVRFQNYLTSVFDLGPMRNRYDKYNLKFSKDEKKYNETGEKVTNFSENFNKKSDNGDQYYGFSFNHSENGESSDGYILSVTTEEGQFAYRKFDNKKDYDEALARVKKLK